MKQSFHYLALLLLASLLYIVTPAQALAAGHDEHQVFLNSDQMKWQNAPPELPGGAKITVLYGDPTKAGPYVMRMSTPARYTIRPHWHTRAESLTVISGALYLGGGDTFERGKAQQLKPGGYHYLPAQAHHFAFTDQPTVIQVHGEGPFDIHYINPADDPRNAAKK